MDRTTSRKREVFGLNSFEHLSNELPSKLFRSMLTSRKIYLSTFLLITLVSISSLHGQPVPLSFLNYQVNSIAYEHSTDCIGGNQSISFSVGAITKLISNSFGTTTGDNCITYTQSSGSTDSHVDERTLLIAKDQFPGFVELGWSAWNESNSSPTSDPCVFQTYLFFPDDCDLDANTITYDVNDFPCNNWASVIEQPNDSRLFVRYISRYAGGTQSRPLDLGTRTHQTAVEHINDNSPAPATPSVADPDMGYFNFFDGTSYIGMNTSNDVHYVFTLTANSHVFISTDFVETILDDQISLFQEDSGSELLLSNSETILAHLPAGDYRIVVEGKSSNDHGKFKLALFTQAITVDPGSIIASSTHCPYLTTSVAFNETSPSLVPSGESFIDPPMYSWSRWINGDMSTETIISGANGLELPESLNHNINSEFDNVTFSRQVVWNGVGKEATSTVERFEIDLSVCSGAFVLQEEAPVVLLCTNISDVPAPPASCISSNAFGQGYDIWYTSKVPPSGRVRLGLDAEFEGCVPKDWIMIVYTGSCGSLQLLNCDDDSGPDLHPSLDITEFDGVIPGDDLYIRILRFGGIYPTELECARITSKALPCVAVGPRTFTGQQPNDLWNDDSNWLEGSIPQRCDDVVVPVNNNCNVVMQAECHLLEVKNGGALTINSSTELTVHGN